MLLLVWSNTARREDLRPNLAMPTSTLVPFQWLSSEVRACVEVVPGCGPITTAPGVSCETMWTETWVRIVAMGLGQSGIAWNDKLVSLVECVGDSEGGGENGQEEEAATGERGGSPTLTRVCPAGGSGLREALL